jgi:cytoskeletal protein RodZ
VAILHKKVDHEPKLEFSGPFGHGPRETVADLVRRARKDFGQDLRTVAEVLRIRLAYLEAIESGDFDRLPGTTYAVGFLRTYADYLGLDGEEIVERFKAETQAAERRSELIFPEPVAEGRIPGGAIIFVSVLLLALAYGGWFYLSQQGRSVADLIPAWPSQTQTATAPEAEQTPVAAAPASTESPADQGPASAEAAAEATMSEAKAPEMTAPAVTVSEPKAPEVTVPEVTVPKVVTPTAAPAAQTSPPAATESTGAPPTADTVATPGASTSDTVDTAPEPPTLTTLAEAAAAQALAPAPAPEQPAFESAAPSPVASSPVASSPEPTSLAAAADQTVLIPAPPTSSETVIIPDDRSPRVYGGSNDESRIVIRALQDSWVQVRDPQEAILLTRVLRAGDSYRVPNVAGLTLLTGNAGGIELEVDGIRLPPAGPPGAVRRSIALDPAQLLSGTANR